MDKRTKLLILNRTQFGYHIDTYYYCKYLCDDFCITYLGWDYEQPYLKVAGVNVIYISRKYNKVKRYINFIKACISECRKDYDIVFIEYFPFCQFIKLFVPNNNYVVDIRTGALTSNRLVRMFKNIYFKWEANNFKNITVISSSLARKLGLNISKTQIIPLGADIISNNNKSYKEMKLLYVGTFHFRNLEDTILGVAKFYRENRHQIKMNYIIIGYGYHQEEKMYASLIKKEGLEDIISVVGHVPHDKLKPYFDKQNIGVSFIPITPYFDCQPPTKTFEYLLSGMPVIATATHENALVVNDENGVLIKDTADSFCKGLEKLANNRVMYNSEKIRTTRKQSTWENIIHNKLKDYLIKVSEI